MSLRPNKAGVPATTRSASAAAAMTVAQGFTAREPRLGLGMPLALRGGEPDALRRLAVELGLGWQPQLRSMVDQAINQARDKCSPWFKLPPLLLTGERGVGRTHAARRIAHAAGVPHAYLDLTDPAGIEQLRPRGCGPDLMLPSLPVLTMAISGCANPIISVVGCEDLDRASVQDFAAMIDPATAGRFVDHATGCVVDLRQVSWIAQCRDPREISAALSGLFVAVEMRWPGDESLPLHVAEVLAEAAIDTAVIDQVGDQVADALAHLSRMCRRRSTAEIYEAAGLWLGTHCH